MPRRKIELEPFVVVVRFPSGGREYHYLCNDPTIRQGSKVIANGTTVEVIRTLRLTPDSPASKFIKSDAQLNRRIRMQEIATRLDAIQRSEERIAAWAKLTSPEAKRLVRELKELSK